MNKDFMLLNDGTYDITDEKNNIINRNIENKSVKEFLLSENKIEIINNIIDKLNIKIKTYSDIINLSNKMIKFQPLVVIIVSFIGFINGCISHPDYFLIYGIYNSIYATLTSLIPVTITTLYYNIIKRIYKRGINIEQNILDKANKLKTNYDEEMQLIKTTEEVIEPIVKISLVDETNIIKTNIEDELYFSYYRKEDTNKKIKSRIRKR